MFQDREDAGRQLAKQLTEYRSQDPFILALPRGGVPVAFEVAMALDALLDVFLVRKLGVPSQKELAMGAIASGGVRVLNDSVVSSLHISEAAIEHVAKQEQRELERRERLYRNGLPALDLRDRSVILVDDGLATGSTMRAAITALRQWHPSQIIVGVPASPPEICHQLAAEVDQIVCLITPQPFNAVGRWYKRFPQTSDEEVRDLLRRAAQQHPISSHK